MENLTVNVFHHKGGKCMCSLVLKIGKIFGSQLMHILCLLKDPANNKNCLNYEICIYIYICMYIHVDICLVTLVSSSHF